MTQPDREQQIAQAEEILGDRLQEVGFAKGLFFGQFLGDRLLPYPDLHRDPRADDLVARLREYCAAQIDPVAIDRQAEIPQAVIAGLGKLGVLGACLPKAVRRAGTVAGSATAALLEVLGGHCGSTALFVNAHHSIGPRALVLFGTPEQQKPLAAASWPPANGSAPSP